MGWKNILTEDLFVFKTLRMRRSLVKLSGVVNDVTKNCDRVSMCDKSYYIYIKRLKGF